MIHSRMTHSIFQCLSCRAFLLVAAFAISVKALAAERPPNIVFLLADDQRYDMLSYTGNTILQTPRMDALAENGVFFDRDYVVSSACAPNRAAIFSGMFSRSSGVRDFSRNFTPEVAENLYPFVLQRGGYHIGFIGKWGVAATIESTMERYAERFDYWRGFVGQGDYYTPDRQDRHLTQVMADQAIEFFENAPKDRPFNLSVSFKAPHGPWHGFDRRFRGMFDDVEIPLPVTLTQEAVSKLPPFMRTYRLSLNGQTVDHFRRVHGRFVREFYRLTVGLDEAVGRIVDALEEMGLADNTIIIYGSDNGHFIHEWGFHGKWLAYEPSIHVPLIIYDPRLPDEKRGARVQAFSQSIDYAPTMIEMAGLPIPDNIQGRSLVPLLHGNIPDDWRDDIFHDYIFEMYPGDIPKNIAVRTERYKLVRYTAPRPQFEQLFDLERDPLEIHNFIDDPDYFEIRHEMRQRLSRYRQDLPDILPDFQEYVNTYDVVGIGADFMDGELDFHALDSVGQVFPAAGEHLYLVEWRWPFFMQHKPSYGVRVSLFEEGPQGRRLGSVEIPGEELFNLNLVRARFDIRGLTIGQQLYVEIEPTERPRRRREVGFFFYSDNPFPEGHMLANGAPLSPETPGLRRAASNNELTPQRTGGGALPLSFVYRK